MKQIPLGKYAFTIVDDDDFEYLNQWNWHDGANGQAARGAISEDGTRKTIYMSRVIMNAKPNEIVDHINGNVKDNQKSNLRICTKKENSWNRGMSVANTTGFPGVYRKGNKFQASIRINGYNKYLGTFETAEAAFIAREAAGKALFKEFYPDNPFRLSSTPVI